MNPTLAALLADNVARYFGILIKEGFTQGQAASRIIRRYPTASYQTINAAYNFGARSEAAADAFNALTPTGQLPASVVPRGPGQGLGYRYYVEATLGDPSGQSNQTRSFTIDSSGRLSPAELASHVADAAHQRYDSPVTYQGRGGVVGEFIVVSSTVIAIERN